MKIFVTGVGGQLGHDVVKESLSRGYYVVGSDVIDYTDAKYCGSEEAPISSFIYEKLDITDAESVSATIERIHPDVIIHSAA